MSAPNVQYKIGNGMRAMMFAVALMFDVLPVLLVVVAGIFVLMSVGDLGVCFETGIWATAKCAYEAGKMIITGAVGTMALMFLGPFVYAILALCIDLIAMIVFTIWFWMLGVHMWEMSGKKIVTNLFTVVIESIPFLQLLPGITVNVLVHITLSRAKDRKEAAATASKQMRQERHQRQRGLELSPTPA